MALACVSAPRLHPHRLQSAKGLSLGNTKALRISEVRKAPARSKWQQHATHCLLANVVACGIGPAFLAPSTCSYDASEYMQSLGKSIQQSLHGAAANSMQGLILADIDPATAKLAIGIAGPFLSAFGFLFIIRIVMSWYPKLPVGKFPYVIAYAPTEPFLQMTRKVIPPLGGVDVTPVVWFGLVSFLNEILVGPQGLLVLLSRQV